MKRIDEILDKLKKFSLDVLTLNPPVDSMLVINFEERFGIKLSNDYIYLLSQTNGFNLMGDEILGISCFPNTNDLAETYYFEHFEVIYPQYKHLIPFYPDGGDNFYCFDSENRTKDGDSCKIVFWYSNYQYTESDTPEITHDCLADFINECIIGWTLENYNYDGSRK